MADVAKWLTHRIVAPAFRGFDSHRPPHLFFTVISYSMITNITINQIELHSTMVFKKARYPVPILAVIISI